MRDKIEKLKSIIYKGEDKIPTLSPTRLNAWQYILDCEDELSKEDIIDRLLPQKTTPAMMRGINVENMVLESLGLVVNDKCGCNISSEFVKPAVDRIENFVGKINQNPKDVILSQYKINKPLELFDGRRVNILGNVDLVALNMAYDIKYKEFYIGGDVYANSYQHRSYLYALKDIGITDFEYLILIGKNDKKGDFAVEYYSWNEEFEIDLKVCCSSILEFVDNLL